MAVTCAQCGEELFGAVNRCWKCGASIVAHAGRSDEPPVRRSPVVLPAEPESHVVAEFADDAEAIEAVSADSDRDADESNAESRDTPEPVLRRVGSPFAPNKAEFPAVGSAPIPSVAITQPNYPKHTASGGGAVAALVLGIMSLIASFFTIGALFTCVLGIVMGVWGLYSKKRGMAMVGILMCCVAMAIAGFNGIVDVYEYEYGYKPWDVAPVVPSEDGFDDTMNGGSF